MFRHIKLWKFTHPYTYCHYRRKYIQWNWIVIHYLMEYLRTPKDSGFVLNLNGSLHYQRGWPSHMPLEIMVWDNQIFWISPQIWCMLKTYQITQSHLIFLLDQYFSDLTDYWTHSDIGLPRLYDILFSMTFKHHLNNF